MIKGYKVFNPDWTCGPTGCNPFQYKVGATFEEDVNISICNKGFHFCRKASDCFNYYDFNPQNKVAEVEALGNVETDGTKSVTNKIRIVREIPWTELLTIVNTGKSCTGDCNTGDCNTGNCNTGNRNTGDWNTGDRNTGNRNTGDWNTGDWNTGDRNTGNRNTGDWNTGDCNTGDWNTGDWNTGNRNTGDWNTGDWNTGSWNTGNRNTGSWNTGSWNTGSWNTGFFSTVISKPTLFEKPINLSHEGIYNLPGMQVLNWSYENNWWIYSKNMTKEEKQKYPEHETLGGYLKSIPFKDACILMWDNLTQDDKNKVLELPNFDADIFLKITGIDVR